MTAARDITAAVRTLFPAPVRVSTRQAGAWTYLLRLPRGAGNQVTVDWLNSYLGRHLDGPVAVTGCREVRRHDGGTNVEYTIKTGGTQ
jgi:hypothetical protein